MVSKMSSIPTGASGSEASDLPQEWSSLVRWVRRYSYVQLYLVFMFIFGAHILALVGKPWTTCMEGFKGALDWACVGYFHVYEVPMAVLYLYIGLIGLRRFSYAALPSYFYLALIQLVAQMCFLTFEARIVFDSLARNSPFYEDGLLIFANVIMVASAIFGFYVIFIKLMPSFLTWHRPAREPHGS